MSAKATQSFNFDILMTEDLLESVSQEKQRNPNFRPHFHLV